MAATALLVVGAGRRPLLGEGDGAAAGVGRRDVTGRRRRGGGAGDCRRERLRDVGFQRRAARRLLHRGVDARRLDGRRVDDGGVGAGGRDRASRPPSESPSAEASRGAAPGLQSYEHAASTTQSSAARPSRMAPGAYDIRSPCASSSALAGSRRALAWSPEPALAEPTTSEAVQATTRPTSRGSVAYQPGRLRDGGAGVRCGRRARAQPGSAAGRHRRDRTGRRPDPRRAAPRPCPRHGPPRFAGRVDARRRAQVRAPDGTHPRSACPAPPVPASAIDGVGHPALDAARGRPRRLAHDHAQQTRPAELTTRRSSPSASLGRERRPSPGRSRAPAARCPRLRPRLRPRPRLRSRPRAALCALALPSALRPSAPSSSRRLRGDRFRPSPAASPSPPAWPPRTATRPSSDPARRLRRPGPAAPARGERRSRARRRAPTSCWASRRGSR